MSVSEQSYHRIQPRPKSDVEFVPDKLFSYHRIQSRLKSDVEFVPGKFFSYHRILLRPKSDVAKVPDKLSNTIGFGSNRRWMYDLCQAIIFQPIEFNRSRKRMESLCQTIQHNKKGAATPKAFHRAATPFLHPISITSISLSLGIPHRSRNRSALATTSGEFICAAWCASMP